MSQELQSTESNLRAVIEVLIDGQETLRQIAEEFKDESLKLRLLAESLKRAEFRGELENLLHQEGVHDVKESGTTAGKVHRVWADIKTKLGGGDHTLLVTAGQTEDAVRDVYEKAIMSQPSLPLPIRQLLAGQSAQIERFHTYMKAERDRLEAA